MKRFRGWEPVTRYHYRGGRVTSSTVDVEWDEAEQGWMLAAAYLRDNRCPGCGGDPNVTTKPENEEKYRAELPLQCFRCVAFAQDQHRYRDEPYPQSLIHLVPQRPKRR